MKLPFDFGVKLIFRMVLPGFLLSLGLLPLLRMVLQLQGWSDKWEYAFVVMVILLGWAIIIADMPIYILMEGRRFWPGFIKDFSMKRQRERLKNLRKVTDTTEPIADPAETPEAKKKREELIQQIRQRKAEAWFDLRSGFQMDENHDYVVVLPS
ncbi:MAG TPA: hypothetical protein VIF64_07305, partial [Pyrinomonadaceae bacterium]